MTARAVLTAVTCVYAVALPRLTLTALAGLSRSSLRGPQTGSRRQGHTTSRPVPLSRLSCRLSVPGPTRRVASSGSLASSSTCVPYPARRHPQRVGLL